jgi:hypothetical protein
MQLQPEQSYPHSSPGVFAEIKGRIAVIAFLVGISAHVTGCARWYDHTSHRDSGQPTRMAEPPNATAPDSVDLETVIIRFAENQSQGLEQLWQSADEGIIESSQRRALDANGIRVGILRGELPTIVQQQLEISARMKAVDASEVAGLGSDADARMRLIRCRNGRRKELVIRREVDRPLSVVTTLEGMLAGQTFHDRATALFALTPFPALDGTAAIELVPEVQYGESQNRFITTDFGMRQELKRPTKVWKSLKIRASLHQGDVLVLAATQPPKSLGGAFFVSQTIQQEEEHLILLIRLSETPLDDLFPDENVSEALTR